mgnify:CR=1 FL=1
MKYTGEAEKHDEIPQYDLYCPVFCADPQLMDRHVPAR